MELSFSFWLKSFVKVLKKLGFGFEELLKKDIFLDFEEDLDLVGRFDVKLSIENDFFFFNYPDDMLEKVFDKVCCTGDLIRGDWIISSVGNLR